MDGMNRTRIVVSQIEQPTALTLDLVSKYVYWVDIYLDLVGVVDYQGHNRHTIAEGRQQGASALWAISTGVSPAAPTQSQGIQLRGAKLLARLAWALDAASYQVSILPGGSPESEIKTVAGGSLGEWRQLWEAV
ncbi:UNVERIFIED_CONTAM: hypothetical protein K2H54_030285 [Gekko kuhli]